MTLFLGQIEVPDSIERRVEWLLYRCYATKCLPFRNGSADPWSTSRKGWQKFAGHISPHEYQVLCVIKGFARDTSLIPLWKYSRPSFIDAEALMALYDRVVAQYLTADELRNLLLGAQEDDEIGNVPEDALDALIDAIFSGKRRPGELLIDLVARVLLPWKIRFKVDWDLPFKVALMLEETIYDAVIADQPNSSGVPASPSGCEAEP